MAAVTTTNPVESIRARLAPAVAHRDALQRENQRIFELISPYAIDTPGGDRVSMLRARARETSLRADIAEAEADVAQIELELKSALEADRAAQREEFRRRKRPLVAALDKALRDAASANDRLAALEAQECAAVGSGEALAWFELFEETATTASRLASWRRHASAHELL